jgi:hypothetical protein
MDDLALLLGCRSGQRLLLDDFLLDDFVQIGIVVHVGTLVCGSVQLLSGRFDSSRLFRGTRAPLPLGCRLGVDRKLSRLGSLHSRLNRGSDGHCCTSLLCVEAVGARAKRRMSVQAGESHQMVETLCDTLGMVDLEGGTKVEHFRCFHGE